MKRHTIELLVIAAWVVAIVLGPTAAAGAVGTTREVSSALPILTPGVGEVVAPSPGRTARLAVPVRLDEPTSVPVTVHWTTMFVEGAPSQPEPEAPASDYRAAAGVVTIKPGQTTARVTVRVTGDAGNQFEYLVVSFADPTNAVVGGDTWGLGEGLIDPTGTVEPPTVSFGDSVFLFSDVVVVMLNRPTARRVTVSFTTTNGPGVFIDAGEWVGSASSFTPRKGTITVAPGATSGTFTFDVSSLASSDCDFLALNCWPSATVTMGTATNARIGSPSSANVFASP